MIVLDTKKKHLLQGRSVYFVGVPRGFRPGYLGWDKAKPTKHPQVYYNITFQEDAELDRQEVSDDSSWSEGAVTDESEDDVGHQMDGCFQRA